jgi:hypothetical protein
MPFQILNLATDQFVKSESGEFLFFEDGATAFSFAQLETTKTGIKHQPRRVIKNDDSWKMRETARFDSGHYIAPQWLIAKLNGGWFNIPENLFVHVSKLDPAKIAFTQNIEKGVADIQTQIRVGAFLEQYAIFGGELTEQTKSAIIRDCVNEHSTMYAPQEILIARTANEIERIYENGPNSCMAHTSGSYSSFCHPVRVYGDSDLCLYYFWNDETQRATARVLVNESKQIFGRIYGDVGRMEKLLEEKGFANGSFHGLKIRKIYDSSENCFVLPYLDGIQTLSEFDSDYLMIDRNGSIHASQTNGLQLVGEYCDSCEEIINETMHEFYLSRNRSITACETCVRENGFYCHGVDAYVSDSHGAICDGETYADWYIDENATYCEHDNEFTFVECFMVIINDDGHCETWNRDAAHDHAFRCASNGDWYSNDIEQVEINGKIYAACNVTEANENKDSQ